MRYSLVFPVACIAACTSLPIPFVDPAGLDLQRHRTPDDVKPILDKVLRRVNDKFQYDSDSSIYGESDYWNLASEITGWRGDCEDHALLCRSLLREKNDIGSMLLTCWTETGQYHCVLYVQGWVLDVRHSRVMSNADLEKMGYRWHKVGLEDGRWFYVTAVAG